MTADASKPRAISMRWLAYACGFLLLLLLGSAMDLPLQRATRLEHTPSTVNDFFKAAETFGNGWGALIVIGSVLALDNTRRVQTSRLITASLGAGVMANAVKLLVERSRPCSVNLDQATLWDTFGGWLPLLSAGSRGQSFPSAHTATAFGLACALALTYPRGARFFWCLALGVGVQRIFTGAHYITDVIAGASLGVAWSYACCAHGPFASMFDRFESWWSRRFGWPLPLDAVGPTLVFPLDESEANDFSEAA